MALSRVRRSTAALALLVLGIAPSFLSPPATSQQRSGRKASAEVEVVGLKAEVNYDTWWTNEPLKADDPELARHWQGVIQWLGPEILDATHRREKLQHAAKRWLEAERASENRVSAVDDFRSPFFEMVFELVDGKDFVDLPAFAIVYYTVLVRPYDPSFILKHLPLPDGRTITWLAAKMRPRMVPGKEELHDVFELEAQRLFQDMGGSERGLSRRVVEDWAQSVIRGGSS